MSLSNFERMLQLADEVFATKNDSNQLDVNQEVIEQLQLLHPNTVSEEVNTDGPIAWVLVIPTTMELMEQFMAGKISENELLSLTPADALFEVIYLCSALVLSEFRRQGITQKLTIAAIAGIKQNHPITHLLVWPFSPEGDLTAQHLAQLTGLTLAKRT